MEDLLVRLNNGQQTREILTEIYKILRRRSKKSQRLKTSSLLDALINLLQKPWQLLDTTKFSCDVSANNDFRSVNSGKNDDTLVAVLALSCIRYICEDFANHFSKKLMYTLLSYIIPNPKFATEPLIQTRFFQFSPSFTSALRASLSRSRGKVKVLVDEANEDALIKGNDKSIRLEHLKSELLFYEPFYHEVFGTEARIGECQVKVPTKSDHVDLSEKLINEEKCWCVDKMTISNSYLGKTGHSKKVRAEITPCDAVITNVLNGNFFWVILGKDNIQKTKEIAEALNSHESQPVHYLVKKLDVVGAKVRTESGQISFRARVLSIKGVVITVQDVDSGQMYEVSLCDLFILPRSLNLTKTPPLAVLACLKGILPTPLDSRASELAASSLSFILRGKNRTASIYTAMSSTFVHALPDLVHCSDLGVALKVIELVTILTYSRIQIVRKAPWFCLIPGILATLKKACLKVAEMKTRNLQHSKANSPCASQNKQANGEANGCKSQALDEEDAATDMSYQFVKALVLTCLICLGNCLFMSYKGKSVFHQHKGLETIIRIYTLFDECQHIKKKCYGVLVNFINNSLPSSKTVDDTAISTVTGVGIETDSGTDVEETDASYTSSFERQISETNLHASPSSCSVETKDGKSSFSKVYQRGAKVSFTQDATHELQSSNQPCPQVLTAIICGMLNSGREGTIYFGIDPQTSVVSGVTLDHGARDELRMGLDRLLMSKITPCVFHLQFQLTFVPVVEIPAAIDSPTNPTGCTEGENVDTPAMFHLDHVYVVEIHLKPIPNVMYSCADDKCYYRLDGQTVELNHQLVRKLLVLEKELASLETIVPLKQQLKKLKQQAAEMGLEI